VLLLAAVCTGATTAPTGRDDASIHERLQALVGPEKRLRDYAPFVTERGEHANLVLFVTDAVDPPTDAQLEDIPTCPGMVMAIPLRGTYHVALVVSGRLINEVAIPPAYSYPLFRLWELPPGLPDDPTLALPMKNTAEFNYVFWGQGQRTTSKKIEPTKLIKLADFNGDGHAWEFRLVQPGACGHYATLLRDTAPASGWRSSSRSLSTNIACTGRTTYSPTRAHRTRRR